MNFKKTAFKIILTTILFIPLQDAFAQMQLTPRPRQTQTVNLIVQHFPGVTINNLTYDELHLKLPEIRNVREQFFSVIRQQLGNTYETYLLIEGVRYSLEVNLASALNALHDTNLPVTVYVSDLIYPSSTSQPLNNGGVYGPSAPPAEPEPFDGGEWTEPDCVPRDFIGPLPVGVNYCPEVPPMDLSELCDLYPELCEDLDGICVLPGPGEFEAGSGFSLFPPSYTVNLGGGWRLRGELTMNGGFRGIINLSGGW